MLHHLSNDDAEIPLNHRFESFTSSFFQRLAPILTELEVIKINFSKTALSLLFKECYRLRKIVFKHTKDGLAWKQVDAFPKHIESLSLIDCGFTDHKLLNHLITGRWNDPPSRITDSTLTHLDISENKNLRIEGIDDWLPCTLQYLNLSHCHQGGPIDLRHLHHLRYFIWRGMRLSNPDLSNFLPLSNLRRVDLQGGHFGDLLVMTMHNLPEHIHLILSGANHHKVDYGHLFRQSILDELTSRKRDATVELDIHKRMPEFDPSKRAIRCILRHEDKKVFIFNQSQIH